MSFLSKAVGAVEDAGGGLYDIFGGNYAPPDTKGKPAPAAPPSVVDDKKYKFKALTDPTNEVQDYTATAPEKDLTDSTKVGVFDPTTLGEADPRKLTDKEYDAITKEASKGNSLAQQILVNGKYKAHDYPTLIQDTNKLEDPFVKALSGMPATAYEAQAGANALTQPYDFSNAEGQVNNLLGQMGSPMKMTTSPETNSYLATVNGIANQGKSDLATSTMGLPSIDTALAGLGPAAKLSEKASPYASLLAALLSHQQYETVYGGTAPSSTGDPAWLQQLIASVTGTSVSGGLVPPSVAAAGATPSTPGATASPTGSNA